MEERNDTTPKLEDGCMRDTPMAFCKVCGTWMNCKRDGIDLDYHRRPGANHIGEEHHGLSEPYDESAPLGLSEP